MRVGLRAAFVLVVTLHAQVIIEPRSKPVTGLERENFRVLDDKLPGTITQFAMEDDPVTVGLLFDTSESVGQSLRAPHTAAMEFFQNRDIQDEFFLVEFASSAKLVVPLTRETGGIA